MDSSTSMIIMSIAMLVAPLFPVIMQSIPGWIQKYSEWSSASYQKLNLKSNLYDDLKKSLSSVKGQDLAINTVIDSICGWSESKKNKIDKTSGGLVIHMAGVSGTGKSMTANILANKLSKNSAIRISYSSINTADKRSCAEQLFGSYTEKSVFNTDVKCNTSYASQLIYNPEVVVVIDEFDKFMLRDDSLQALLWDIADTGRLRIGKDTSIDCSKTIFILTSNASKESIKLKIDKLKTDDSDSLETVNFKQAFLNRITSVYFENFSKDIYKEILISHFKPIKEYYSKKYNLFVDFNNNSLDNMAMELSKMKTGGARNVGIFKKKIYSAINRFKRENSISESYCKNRYDVNVTYDNGECEIMKK